MPSFSLANNRCLACLGTWNADSGYYSATSARSSHSICQWWKLLAKHGQVLSKFPNTWRIQGKARVLYANTFCKSCIIIFLCTSNTLSTKTSKILGAKLLQKTRNFCLWLETWGIYLENQYVTCTQPVLYQNQPILLQGWGKTMAVSENVKFFAPKQVLWVWKFQVG